MYTSFGCNAGHVIDYEAQVGNNPVQETLHGGLEEIVCFGEVMYHYDNETHHLLTIRTFERRSLASSANVAVVLWCQMLIVPVFKQDWNRVTSLPPSMMIPLMEQLT